MLLRGPPGLLIKAYKHHAKAMQQTALTIPWFQHQQHTPSQALTASAAPTSGISTSKHQPDVDNSKDGIRFVFEPDSRKVSFRKWRQRRQAILSNQTRAQVDIMLEGQPLKGIMKGRQFDDLVQSIGQDAGLVVKAALALKAQKKPGYKLPGIATLSLVLCDDARIARLNAEHRGKEGPTDVLSFEMDDELDYKVRLPVKLIGDMVISLDTAQRQADERGHSLRDEVRVLLVHGMLHLCGYDHENNDQELQEMAAAEQLVMNQLGWVGQGLIAAVGAAESSSMHDQQEEAQIESVRTQRLSKSAAVPDTENVPASGFRKRLKTASSGSGSLGVLGNVFGAADVETDSKQQRSVQTAAKAQSVSQSSKGAQRDTQKTVSNPANQSANDSSPTTSSSTIKLVALDMDGTFLDSNSKIQPSSVQAVQAALEKGVTVILATGKARPAAIKACEVVGLAGPDLLVHTTSPGIFLQGLAVHGRGGTQLADAQLPPNVVAQAFQYLEQYHPHGDVSLVAFTGDECVTLRMTEDLQALHHVYYEPLAHVAPSLEKLLQGEPVRKLLFMTSPKVVDSRLKPHWIQAVSGQGATVMQAVPNMLEIVPQGIDKWVGAQRLLKHLGVDRSQFMAVGDGGNDLQLIANAGIGVAMGNAVPAVKEAAKAVVSSHDHDGIAEAFERFVL